MRSIHRHDHRGFPDRLRRGQSPLHRPYGERPHVYEGTEVAVSRPAFWRLESIPARVKTGLDHIRRRANVVCGCGELM